MKPFKHFVPTMIEKHARLFQFGSKALLGKFYILYNAQEC